LVFKMTFTERGKAESLAEHLLRNADHLALSEDQRSRLLAAYRLSVVVIHDKDKRAEARREGDEIANRVRDELDASLDDVARAAMRRGERVSQYNDDGARRIKSRDGLAALAEGGAISEQEAKDGMAYRLLFEEAGKGAGLGSQLEDRPKSIRSSTHGAVAHGLFRAYVGVRLTGIETAVNHADASGRALAALRGVAGEGRSVRSLGRGGDVRTKNLAALRLALRVVRAAIEGNYGLKSKRHLANQGH
jgi:hypothetical protein